MDQTTQTVQVTMETIKQQLLTEALEIIKGTKEGVLKALDYLQAQISDVIKQFLNWELAVGVMGLVLGIVLVLGVTYSWKRFQKGIKNDDIGLGYNDGDLGIIWLILNIIFTGTGLAFVLVNIYKIVYILVAPKIYLIKWIMNNIHL